MSNTPTHTLKTVQQQQLYRPSEQQRNFNTLFQVNTLIAVLVTLHLVFTMGLLFYLDSLDKALGSPTIVLRGSLDTCESKTLNNTQKQFLAEVN